MSEQQVKTLYATILRSELEELRARASLPVGVPDGLLTRIDSAIKAFTSGRASMHVPPEPDDVDVVLSDCWNLVNAMLAAPAAQPAAEPDCDRSACGDFSPGPCDNPDCTARRDKPAALLASAEPVSQKYDDVLLPFLSMMRVELHANTGKGDRPGWLAMSPEQCLLEIYYHTAKLQKAVKNNDMKGVREYTADVANMSMMLADTCGWLDVVRGELAANEQKPMAELISQHRIAITPEHEGQWHADLYGSEAEPLARAEGATPEAAVAAVVALYQSMQEQQP